MESRDLIVTPIFLVLIYFSAYQLRARFTDEVTKRYFIPALTIKIIGSLFLGLIYFYYYGGGDTFSYHTYGSRVVWEAFIDSPEKGLKLLFSDGYDTSGIFKYSSKILFFGDNSSYDLVRISAFFDLFTFSTYTSTAIFFALFSFVGMWLFFKTFYNKYPQLHKPLAIAIFFIPSVFFWGSGLLKDAITLGCLGFATYATNQIFIVRKNVIRSWIVLVVALFTIYEIKLYILLCYLPAVIVWVSYSKLKLIQSPILKIFLFPIFVGSSFGLSYLAVSKTGEGDSKYALDKLATTAQVTAYDIRYYTGRNAGSGYSIGELDGTFGSMMALAPQAINVSLFRPYVWEVSNPFMLLSSLESLSMLVFALYILIKRNTTIFKTLTHPDIFFCLIFSISFAFAVGVSTFNFGTLVRYKIPLLPFFSIALILILYRSRIDRGMDDQLQNSNDSIYQKIPPSNEPD